MPIFYLFMIFVVISALISLLRPQNRRGGMRGNHTNSRNSFHQNEDANGWNNPMTNDWNLNGIPDHMEQSMTDFNHNGISDHMEHASHSNMDSLDNSHFTGADSCDCFDTGGHDFGSSFDSGANDSNCSCGGND